MESSPSAATDIKETVRKKEKKKPVFTQEFYLDEIRKIKNNPHGCRRDTRQSVHIPVQCPSISHTPTHTYCKKEKKKKKNGHKQTLFPLWHVQINRRHLSATMAWEKSHIVDSQPPWPRDQNKLRGGSFNIFGGGCTDYYRQLNTLCCITGSPVFSLLYLCNTAERWICATSPSVAKIRLKVIKENTR